MHIKEVNSSYQIERRTEGADTRRRGGLDWHLAGASLIIVGLLNGFTAAEASAGSVLASQGTVARSLVSTQVQFPPNTKITVP